MKKVIVGLLLAALLAGGYLFLSRSGMLAVVMDADALHRTVVGLGFWGPLAAVALMAGAIVWSPIPSAPIALATGAAFGHTWGTVYIVLGAELGALIAFGTARLLGHDRLQKWIGDCPSLGWLQSQNALTGFVFVSRLLPFVSFDVMSYAVGLTSLSLWRFALATLLGVAPVSFALAHFGGEMASGDAQRIVNTVMLIFSFTFVPVVVKVIVDRRRTCALNDRRQPARSVVR